MRSIRLWAITLMLIFIVPAISFKLVRKFQKRAGVRRDSIEYIIQTGSRKEALPQIYLEELLGLSLDQPTWFKQFSKKKATQALLDSFIIHKVRVEKYAPSSVYIDYEVREPIAFLGEFHQVAMDEERIIFPIEGFLSPKNLPELLLGFKSLPRYGEVLEHVNLELALELLQELQGLKITKIDLRNRGHTSYAKQEIVVIIETNIADVKHYLRLGVKDYKQNIEDYRTLRKEDLSDENLMIDFRIDQLAFIEYFKNQFGLRDGRKELIRK